MAHDMAASDNLATEAKSRPRPFKGHTLSEAGQSWWAPMPLLMAFRIFEALIFAALAVAVVVGNSVIVGPSKGWISLVSTAFWGPVIQAIALILLVICGFQARSSPSGASSSSKLPNIAVPMYQTGCALTVFNGLVFIVDGAVSREHWTDILIGTFQVLIFLVDTFALGSMVRFRFGYIWIPVVLFALSMIPVIILVATSAKSSGGLVGVTIGLAAGFVVLILISSLVLTALTRVVPKCCLSGRQLRDETVADDIEEQRDATSA